MTELLIKVHHRGERVAIVSPRTGNVIHVNGKDYTMITGYIFEPNAFPSTARLTTQQLQNLFKASQVPTDWEAVEQEKNQEIYINFNGQKVCWSSLIRQSRSDMNKEQIANILNGPKPLQMRGIDLSYANLSGANLCEADLSGANLKGANLWLAILSRADLSRAILRKSDLEEANLCGATLYGTDLCGTDLRHASLDGANLVDANYNTATQWPDGFDPKHAGVIHRG